ncbi:MAG: hypothetical protein ABSC63_16685 [Candidatus Binataceae bacterium]|jgi:hypothetical protein
MRRLFSQSDLQTLGFFLALIVLSASLPLTTGFVLVSGHSEPELTMNICQPLQTFNLVFNPLIARPAPTVPEFVLCDMGSAMIGESAPSVDYSADPDTPPPKLG